MAMEERADLPAWNSDLDAFEIYHKEKELRLFAEPDLPAVGHGIAGSVGSAVSNAAIYPLNLLITRAQTAQRSAGGKKEKAPNPIDILRKIYDDEGVAGLYAGLGIDTVKHSLDSFLFFMAYNTLRQSRLQSHGGRKHLPVVDELGIGFLAGAFSKFFTSPLSNIVTRLQTAKRGEGAKPSVTSVATKIKEEKGLAGFWTGYSAQLILTLNPSLTFFFHEFLNRIALPKSKREHPPFVATFFLAALSKSLATCVTYPFTLAKARAQTTSKATAGEGGSSEKSAAAAQKRDNARRTIFTVIAHIAGSEGASALYEGLDLEIYKSFISHGLTMVIKESAHKLILQLYFAVLKLRKRFPDRDEQVRAGLSRTVEAASSLRTSAATSARELGSGLFDDPEHGGFPPLQNADELVQSAREWSKSVADDVFETSRLRNSKHADQYKELLVDFISERSIGKPRNNLDLDD